MYMPVLKSVLAAVAHPSSLDMEGCYCRIGLAFQLIPGLAVVCTLHLQHEGCLEGAYTFGKVSVGCIYCHINILGVLFWAHTKMYGY